MHCLSSFLFLFSLSTELGSINRAWRNNYTCTHTTELGSMNSAWRNLILNSAWRNERYTTAPGAPYEHWKGQQHHRLLLLPTQGIIPRTEKLFHKTKRKLFSRGSNNFESQERGTFLTDPGCSYGANLIRALQLSTRAFSISELHCKLQCRQGCIFGLVQIASMLGSARTRFVIQHLCVVFQRQARLFNTFCPLFRNTTCCYLTPRFVIQHLCAGF